MRLSSNEILIKNIGDSAAQCGNGAFSFFDLRFKLVYLSDCLVLSLSVRHCECDSLNSVYGSPQRTGETVFSSFPFEYVGHIARVDLRRLAAQDAAVVGRIKFYVFRHIGRHPVAVYAPQNGRNRKIRNQQFVYISERLRNIRAVDRNRSVFSKLRTNDALTYENVKFFNIT